MKASREAAIEKIFFGCRTLLNRSRAAGDARRPETATTDRREHALATARGNVAGSVAIRLFNVQCDSEFRVNGDTSGELTIDSITSTILMQLHIVNRYLGNVIDNLRAYALSSGAISLC